MAGDRVRGIRLAAVALVCSLLIPGLLTVASVSAEWAPPRTVYVERAGHSIDGLFLDEWRTYPELLGLPISEEMERNVSLGREQPEKRIVQYFQKLAIVYVPDDDRPGWQVQGLPIGREAYNRDKPELEKLKLPSKGACGELSADKCVVLSETGHSLRLGVKEYWESHDGERLIGAPLTEEFKGPDGVTIQYFDNAVLLWNSITGVKLRPIGKEAATAAQVRLTPTANPDDLPIYDESLFVPPIEPVIEVGSGANYGPGPQQGTYKEIVVSISAQSMWAYEESELVISTLVSTGTAESVEVETPIGYHSILWKTPMQTMDGTISGEYYEVEDVPWVMYFDNLGNALHGTYWHSNFGYPMSHGCVNLPLDVAEFLYDWAPEGTAVSVIA